MLDELTYRAISAHECQEAARLIQECLPDDWLERTIYGSPRIAKYLSSLVAYPHWQPQHLMTGAWANDSLVGLVHCRSLGSSWHLNNIVVDAGYRGRRIGSRLFGTWLEKGVLNGFRCFTLDVDSRNQAALSWYTRVGMEVVHTSYIYERSLHNGRTPSRVEIVGWDRAVAWQDAYGFSEFEIRIAEGALLRVGRLGERYFRIVGDMGIEVEPVLYQIDPQRRLLAVLDRKQAPSVGPVHEILRLQKQI